MFTRFFTQCTKLWVAAALLFAVFAPFSVEFSEHAIAPSITYAQETTADTIAKAIKDSLSSSLGGLTNIGAPVMEAGANFMGQLILKIGVFALWFGGNIFDLSLEWFVVEFGSRILDNDFGIGEALTNSWATVRDLCNLTFIFGFIYIGIKTIIDPDSSRTKRFLSQIIIGAILINFSLYLSQAIIDFTNFNAVKIYDAIVPPGAAEELTISRAIGNYLGINTFYQGVSGENLATLSGDASRAVAYYLMATIFMVVTGFTLAAGGFLLFIRFVELIFIMIFSPLYFAARVFPQTEKYASDILGKLLSRAFFAPAYLLLLYLSLAIANKLAQNIEGTMVDALIEAKTGTFPIILNFCLIIFLMVQAITLANRFSITGSKMVINAGSSLQNNVRGAIGRNTLGRASGALLDGYQKLDAKVGTSNNRFLKTVRWGMDKSGATQGIQNTLKTGKTAKYGGTTTTEALAKVQKDQDAQRTKLRETTELAKKVTAAATAPTSAETAATNTAQIELEKAMLGASTTNLIATLQALPKNSPSYKKFTASLAHSQFEKLMEAKEEELSDDAKGELKKARQEFINTKLLSEENEKRAEANKTPLTKANDTGSRAYAAASLDELGVLEFEDVLAHAGHLTASQIDDMKKDKKKWVETQIKQIEVARKKYFDDIVALTGTDLETAIADEFKSRKAKDVAKLPANFLTKKEARQHFTPDILKIIFKEDTIDHKDQVVVVQNVSAYAKDNLTNPDEAIAKRSGEITRYMDTPFVQDRFFGRRKKQSEPKKEQPSGENKTTADTQPNP